MSNIYFISGPCGCGKSTLAEAYAKHLVNKCGKKQVYLIHGDDFHAGFIETNDKGDSFVNGQDAIRQRITRRGDTDMIERALFLKNKLDNMPENQGHLFDNTWKTIEQEVEELEMERYALCSDISRDCTGITQ